MDYQLKEWSDLWTTKAKDYLLIRTLDPEKGLEDCIIFNKRNRTILKIEDNNLYKIIKNEMRKAGIPIVDKFPTDPIDKLIEEMFDSGMDLDEINEKRWALLREREQGLDNLN